MQLVRFIFLYTGWAVPEPLRARMIRNVNAQIARINTKAREQARGTRLLFETLLHMFALGYVMRNDEAMAAAASANDLKINAGPVDTESGESYHKTITVRLAGNALAQQVHAIA